ncbi:MAG: hypothetical protein V6Z78_01920 [Holosporaceae bacterium]
MVFFLLTAFFNACFAPNDCETKPARPLLQIISIPAQPNLIPSEKMTHIFLLMRQRHIQSFLKGGDFSFTFSRHCLLTPEEARLYGESLFKSEAQKRGLSEEACAAKANIYFSCKNFGLAPIKAEDHTPKGIWGREHSATKHLMGMMRDGSPGFEGTLEKATKRWHLETMLLTPEQAYDQVSKKTTYCTVQHYCYDAPFDEEWTFEDMQTPPYKKRPFKEFQHAFPIQAAAFSDQYFLGKIFQEPDPAKRQAGLLQASFGIMNAKNVNHFIKVAHQIMALSDTGDTFVIFGCSPYFVGRALEHVCGQKGPASIRNVVFFPFSGSPNHSRLGSLQTDADNVTESRYHHLQNRLKNAGLTSANPALNDHTIHFVDVIGSGAGPAFVMEEILRDFQKAHMAPPQLHVCSLNAFVPQNDVTPVSQDTIVRHQSITDKNVSDGETCILSFPSKQEVHFRVPATVTRLPCHAAFDMIADENRMVPQYNAYLWNKAYDECLLNRSLTKVQQAMQDYFDIHAQALLNGSPTD